MTVNLQKFDSGGRPLRQELVLGSPYRLPDTPKSPASRGFSVFCRPIWAIASHTILGVFLGVSGRVFGGNRFRALV
jgi:hypothetical protein